jgi:hypothetical protein
MNHRKQQLSTLALAVMAAALLATAPLNAHHVPAAKFDPDRPMTLQGSISKVDWLNPHVHLFVEVRNGDATTSWAVELASTLDLRRSGWTSTTVKPGDTITVTGTVARDGSRQIWGDVVTLASSGERVFAVVPEAPPVYDDPDAPTPRWPDNQPHLGVPPGQTGGYWAFPTESALMEDGFEVPVDSNGLLQEIADADKIAPFQPWARDLYEYRQRNFLKDDPMFVDCKTQAGPRIFQRPYGVVLLEEREHQRIRNFWADGNQNWRTIFLDGREQTGFPEGNGEDPLYWGHAVGQWEGDTLVIDTKGFNDKFWFSNGGLPHTPQLHLVERYTRTNQNTLHYEVTIDDPGAYTRSWTASWDLKWVPNAELPTYYCQDNRP